MANQKMVKQWFTFAVRDLKAAKALLVLGGDFKSSAAFHSQQCVEKAVKGFLVYHGVRPSKTHSISQLSDLVAEIDTELSKLVRMTDKLTKYAVEYRYPDAIKKSISMRQCQWSVEAAHKIYDLLLSRIK